MTRSVRLSLAVAALLTASSACAVEIFVDNLNGSDSNNGAAPGIQSATTGPVRTLQRGVNLIRQGDSLVIMNHGQPYFEPLRLCGGRTSGQPSQPLIIEGNGALICGLRQLPSAGWQPVGEGLWRLTITRKGYYRFFKEGQALTEYLPASATFPVDELPENQWAPLHGAVYFRLPANQPPADQQWTYAAEEQGISLVDIRNVQINDLSVMGFRVDGINADNTCRNIVLDRIVSENNGRAGLAAGGSAKVRLQNSRIAENGRYSILVTESAGVDVQACDLGGVEPTVVKALRSPSPAGASLSAAASTSAKVKPVVLKK